MAVMVDTILVKRREYGGGYCLARRIEGDVYEELSDQEAKSCGLTDGNAEHDLRSGLRRLIVVRIACADGAPWSRPVARRRGGDGG